MRGRGDQSHGGAGFRHSSEQQAGVDKRYRSCIAMQPTNAETSIESEIDDAMSNIDFEYAALCADALVAVA